MRTASLTLAILASSTALADTPVPAPRPGRSYFVSGAIISDGCDGRILIRSHRIDIDLAAGTLHADGVDRYYSARRSGDRIVAQGRFQDQPGTCAGSDMVERITIDPASANGELDGVVRSSWHLPCDCDRACDMVFEIHLTPLAEGR